jgi:hypothetical protein
MWISGLFVSITSIFALSQAPTLSVIQLVLGIASIAFGVGLWQMAEWAWAATLVLRGLDVVGWIALWMQYGRAVNSFRAVIALIIDGVIIIYLLQPDVRKVFRN